MEDSQTKVEFATLDPFNISFYDRLTDTIYIDRKVKKYPKFTEHLIRHEEKHVEKKKDSIFHIEPYKEDTKWFLPSLKLKPLFAFQWIFPFMYAKTDSGRKIFRIDPFGLVLTIVLIVAMVLLVNWVVGLQTGVGCSGTIKTGIVQDLNCQVCYAFQGCEEITYDQAKLLGYSNPKVEAIMSQGNRLFNSGNP